MGDTVGDYSDSLANELVNTNTNSNSLFTDNYVAPTGNTANVNNSYNQLESDAFNSPAGNTSNNYVMPGAYTMDANGNKTMVDSLAGLQKFITDNKGLITAGGAALGLMGANNPAYGKSGYQGAIPELTAGRAMITAPPTRAQGYRPGAGGINYGGDVTYARTPGVDPWAYLSGTSGTSAGANLTAPTGLTSLPANVATAVNNAVTGGTTVTPVGTKVVTPTVVPTKVVTPTTVPPTVTTNLGSAGYQAAIKSGLTPTQYYGNINQWLIDNPRASKAQIDAIMAQVGVSQEDLQKALGTANFSDYTKYGLTHGQGLQELNFKIADWVSQHPYATAQEIKDIMKAAGVNQEDVSRGLNGLSASAGKEAAVVGGMGLDQLYKNILDYQAAGHTPEETAAALAATGLDQRDLNAANKYATEKGYVGNAKSEAATYDYLGNTNKAVDTTAANTSAVDNSAANTLAAVDSNAGTSVVQQPITQQAVTQEVQQPVAQSTAAAPAALDTKNDIYQYFADPATQAALASGNTRSIAETMQALGWSPAEVAAATGSNPAEVQAAYDAAISSNKVGAYDPYSEAFAGGGMAKGRYLQGETDGMADKLPAQIGQNQPAALSHGEFVIPADVVSHMGNGNSDAGAKKLYQMMDKIRMARTGTKKQGKQINPDKFMPGGLAKAYAAGGSVKHFVDGGPTGSAITAGLSGVESNLSNWAGPYVTNMLGQGQALANMPYTPYMGQLTAGESPLQTQAFGNAAGLTTPSSIGEAAKTAGAIGTAAQGLSYDPTSFTNQYASPVGSSFDAAQAQTYMNPYLQASLNPQLEEARRQSQITQQGNAAKMTQAGAFGGGRQAILDAETQRSLGANLANITGTGYNTAYNNAQQQFNADQARKIQEAQLKAQYGMSAQQAAEQSKQYGAGYGLQGLQTGLQAAQAQGSLGSQESQAGLANLNAQLTAGTQQRGIESEGIAADKAQFEEARANPYKMVQFQQSLLQGLPLAAQSYNMATPSALSSAAAGATTIADLIDILNGKTPAKKI